MSFCCCDNLYPALSEVLLCRVCWDDFTITVVPVTVYYVQIFEAVGADSSNDSIPVGRQYRYPNSSESPDLERRISGDQISVQLHSLELRVNPPCCAANPKTHPAIKVQAHLWTGSQHQRHADSLARLYGQHLAGSDCTPYL